MASASTGSLLVCIAKNGDVWLRAVGYSRANETNRVGTS